MGLHPLSPPASREELLRFRKHFHLSDGIYAEMIARYRDGKYRPFEWTFPDFRDGRYDTELEGIRATYLGQLRSLRRA